MRSGDLIFDSQEKEVLIFNNVKYLVKNFDDLSRTEIKERLFHLDKLLGQYS
jgi:hypothetical protein